jgi:hypothetical protein
MYGALFTDYGARVSTGFGADDGGLRELFVIALRCGTLVIWRATCWILESRKGGRLVGCEDAMIVH